MEFKSGAVNPVETIKEGWELIKNDYWTFVLMILVFGVIVFVASLILGTIANLIAAAIASAIGFAATRTGDFGHASASIMPQIIAQFVSVFTNIIVITLTGTLMCGLYKSLHRISTGLGGADFSDLFAGFENIKACFIYAVVYSLIGLALGVFMLLGAAAVGFSAFGMGIGSILTREGKLDPSVFGGFFAVFFVLALIGLVINVVITALTVFVYPLIAERNLSGTQALLLSIKSGAANLGGLILLLILLWLMFIGGFILCLIGVLFVSPIFFATIFSAYQRVFGKTESSPQHEPPPPPTFGYQPGY